MTARASWLLATMVGLALSGAVVVSRVQARQPGAGVAGVIERFLDAAQREDAVALAALLDEGVTMTLPMTASGALADTPRFIGREATTGYFARVFELMGRIAFSELEVSVVEGGNTAFVEAAGDFLTADGRPYRNVYVFKFEVRDDRIVGITEYGNPVGFAVTFGGPLGPAAATPAATQARPAQSRQWRVMPVSLGVDRRLRRRARPSMAGLRRRRTLKGPEPCRDESPLTLH